MDIIKNVHILVSRMPNAKLLIRDIKEPHKEMSLPHSLI